MPYMRKSTHDEKILKRLKGKTHSIYGIYDFKCNVLLFVSLDLETAELEYDLQSYDETCYKVVSFEVLLF
jgi:hypothetical protein